MNVTKESVGRIRKIAIYVLSVFLLLAFFFLFFRIFFRLLDANPASPFILFIYLFAGVFKAPFFNAFPDLRGYEDAAFDIVSSIAIFTYFIFYLVLLALVLIVSQLLLEVSKMPPTISAQEINDLWGRKREESWQGLITVIEERKDKESEEKKKADEQVLTKLKFLQSQGAEFPESQDELIALMSKGEPEETSQKGLI